MRDRPRVTVTDPAGDGRPLDVVDSEDPDPGSPRRLLAAGGVALLLLIAVSGSLELRERRLDGVQERRLQAVLELRTTARFGFFQEIGFDAEAREGVLTRPLGLRNDGPRPVTVVSAAVDGLTLRGGEVVIAPGDEERLLLEQRVPCDRRPEAAATGGPLRLDVRTGAGERRLDIDLGEGTAPSQADARRACGYLRVSEAVQVEVGAGVLTGDRALIDVQLTNRGVLPARLFDIGAGQGLATELLTPDGDPLPLPLVLTPRSPDGTLTDRRAQLVVRVADCGSTDPGAVGSFSDTGTDTVRYVTAAPDGGSAAAFVVLQDATPVLDLIAAQCPDR